MENLNKTRFHFDISILTKMELPVNVQATLSGTSPLDRLFSIKPKAPI